MRWSRRVQCNKRSFWPHVQVIKTFNLNGNTSHVPLAACKRFSTASWPDVLRLYGGSRPNAFRLSTTPKPNVFRLSTAPKPIVVRLYRAHRPNVYRSFQRKDRQTDNAFQAFSFSCFCWRGNVAYRNNKY